MLSVVEISAHLFLLRIVLSRLLVMWPSDRHFKLGLNYVTECSVVKALCCVAEPGRGPPADLRGDEG